MIDAERQRLWHGGSDPLPERIGLRAGPLSLTFEAGDLRDVRLGSRQILRRMHGAVRDEHWATVPPCVSGLSLDAGPERFRLTYVSDHRGHDVHFTWKADLEGTADGALHFRFDGIARCAFRRNRIGICVLHPIRGCAGSRVRATYRDGTVRDLVFPATVSIAQPMEGFRDLAGLAHEVAPGTWAEFTFEGDVFETEDQRNWIDASYKTYGTPLSQPIPVEVPEGTRVVQAVSLRITGTAARPPSGPTAARVTRVPTAVIAMAEGPTRAVPPVGFTLSRDDRPLRDPEITALRMLKPAHLRVDLRLAEASWRRVLGRAALEAARLGCAIELAVHLPPGADAPPDALDAARSEGLRVARLLVYTDGRPTTAPASLDAVRSWMRKHPSPPDPPIGTGTTGDLYRISLHPPPVADILCWSMHPQVHAVDATSIAETPEGARDQIASMKHYHPGARLAASAITFGPGGEPDPRQRSLFAAGWTLAILRALCEAGADSLTFCETVGPAGLMDEGGVFPMFHVFAALSSVLPARVLPTTTTSDHVAALCLTRGARDTLLLANLSRDEHDVQLPDSFREVRLCRIDAADGRGALGNPRAFIQDLPTSPRAALRLPPFGLARVDSTR